MAIIRKLSIGIVIALCANAAGAQKEVPEFACADSSAVQAVQKIVEAWKDGYNSRDPARVAALYSPNAYYLTQHFASGIVHGREAIQAYVKVGTDAGYHIDSIRTIALGCSGNVAYAVTRYESTKRGQTAFGVNLVVMRREAEKWVIVSHEAAVPDPVTAIRELDIPVPLERNLDAQRVLSPRAILAGRS
jgi:ketosteroid isomerase-like protein